MVIQGTLLSEPLSKSGNLMILIAHGVEIFVENLIFQTLSTYYSSFVIFEYNSFIDNTFPAVPIATTDISIIAFEPDFR